MKNIVRLLAMVSGIAILISCEQEKLSFEQTTDSKEQIWLSVQKAVNGVQDLMIFPQIEERKEVFNVNFGGVGLPASDIYVKFEVDQSAFDSTNRVRVSRGQEPYLQFPSGSFSLDKKEGIINPGNISSDYLTLSYKPESFDITKEYLLALKATNDQGYQFRENGNTIYFLASVTEKVHEKSGWVASASSEEKEGEGASNGLARFVIDNNISTFWHSQWQGGSPEFPHTIEVDFKKELYITQIGLTRRQNNTNGFKKFDVLGTRDGTTWTTILSDQEMLREELEMQKFPITAQYLSKIKLIMKDNFNNQASTHLAEIDLIGY